MTTSNPHRRSILCMRAMSRSVTATTAGLVLCLVIGCSEWSESMYVHSTGPFPVGHMRDHSRDPYYGTGTVVRMTDETVYAGKVYLGKIAYVDFGENKTPQYFGMTLLVVRDKSLVGKLGGGGAGGGETPLGGFGCNLLEGTAEKGDTVVGLQHQREYKKAY